MECLAASLRYTCKMTNSAPPSAGKNVGVNIKIRIQDTNIRLLSDESRLNRSQIYLANNIEREMEIGYQGKELMNFILII